MGSGGGHLPEVCARVVHVRVHLLHRCRRGSGAADEIPVMLRRFNKPDDCDGYPTTTIGMEEIFISQPSLYEKLFAIKISYYYVDFVV